MSDLPPDAASPGLVPGDWPSARAQAHRMQDDILDHVERVREPPVWRPIPDAVRAAIVNLQHANLRNADLRGSVFFMVDFTGADLTGARTRGTLFFLCSGR